jgi:hypothetical protein
MMNLSDLEVTTAGINFSVQPTFRFGNQRNLSTPTCFISNETLDELAAYRLCKSDLPEKIFRELEKEITGVAARLSLALAEGTPLVIRYRNFTRGDN